MTILAESYRTSSSGSRPGGLAADQSEYVLATDEARKLVGGRKAVQGHERPDHRVDLKGLVETSDGSEATGTGRGAGWRRIE